MRANKRRRDGEAALAEYIVSEFNIACDECGESDSVMCFGDDEAATCFYDSGWRVIDDKVLCKRCRRKVEL